jgi:hypothetical protein
VPNTSCVGGHGVDLTQDLDGGTGEFFIRGQTRHVLNSLAFGNRHKDKGSTIDNPLLTHSDDCRDWEPGFAQRLHHATLARDIGRARDPGPRRR